MSKGKTLLEIMQEQEPTNNFVAKDICQLYCRYGPMPCSETCSWLELFIKKRFVEVTDNKELNKNMSEIAEIKDKIEEAKTVLKTCSYAGGLNVKHYWMGKLKALQEIEESLVADKQSKGATQ